MQNTPNGKTKKDLKVVKVFKVVNFIGLLPDEEEHRENGECVAQLFESKRQMIFDGLFGDVERVGDCLVVEPEITAHFKYSATLFGHPAYDEPYEQLLFAGIVFVLERFVARLLLDLRHLCEIDVRRAPDLVQCGITRHFIYVAAERADFPPPENFASLPDSGEYVLRYVVCRIAFFDNAIHERLHLRIICVEQLPKGFFVAIREPLHKVMFVFVQHPVSRDFPYFRIKVRNNYANIQIFRRDKTSDILSATKNGINDILTYEIILPENKQTGTNFVPVLH